MCFWEQGVCLLACDAAQQSTKVQLCHRLLDRSSQVKVSPALLQRAPRLCKPCLCATIALHRRQPLGRPNERIPLQLHIGYY
jgi:hypothetical protein